MCWSVPKKNSALAVSAGLKFGGCKDWQIDPTFTCPYRHPDDLFMKLAAGPGIQIEDSTCPIYLNQISPLSQEGRGGKANEAAN
jgi:hypothetical protein